MDRVTNLFSQLQGGSCTVDGAATGLTNPLTEFVNELLGLKSGTRACSLQDSIKRVDKALKKLNEMSKTMSLTPEEQQISGELLRSRQEMEVVWNRYKQDLDFKKKVDTMDKAWKDALNQVKKQQKLKKKKEWLMDSELQRQISYYRNHKHFLLLPIDSQFHLMNPENYPERTIKGELKWLGKRTRGMGGIEPYEKQKLTPAVKSKIIKSLGGDDIHVLFGKGDIEDIEYMVNDAPVLRRNLEKHGLTQNHLVQLIEEGFSYENYKPILEQLIGTEFGVPDDMLNDLIAKNQVKVPEINRKILETIGGSTNYRLDEIFLAFLNKNFRYILRDYDEYPEFKRNGISKKHLENFLKTVSRNDYKYLFQVLSDSICLDCGGVGEGCCNWSGRIADFYLVRPELVLDTYFPRTSRL